MKFYTFGIQRTCTNLANKLILTNFYSVLGNINDAGHWSWKHCSDAEQATANISSQTPLIFCYKTPLLWIESILRDDVGFINRNGLTNYPDYHDKELLVSNSSYTFSIPIAIDNWIKFHIEWMKYIHRSNYVIMSQRKICDQPGAVSILANIENKLKMIKKGSQWLLFKDAVDYANTQFNQDFEKRKSNYLQNKTTNLTNKHIEYINNKIPQEVIDFYEKE